MGDNLTSTDQIKADDPITLRVAAHDFGLSVWTLKAEARRGHLTIYRIGKKFYTTPNDVRQMVAACRVEPKVQGFTLIRSDGNLSSETARASSALAAAKETVAKLKNASRNTSGTSTSRNRQARR